MSLDGWPISRLRWVAHTVSVVQTKLTLVVRADLGMGRGKIAAQAAHAAVAAALATLGTADFRTWLRDGQPKVVLRANSEEQLYAIAERADAAGLPVQLIHDAGRTQVAEGTPTCCAIGPAPDTSIDPVTGELSLL
jgi:peptidyl-tRNA hydrolase, PTH2 family